MIRRDLRNRYNGHVCPDCGGYKAARTAARCRKCHLGQYDPIPLPLGEEADTAAALAVRTLAENVRQARLRADLSLTALAARAGIGHGTLSRIENCQTGASVDLVARVAAALGMHSWQLLQPRWRAQAVDARRSSLAARRVLRGNAAAGS